MAASDNSNDIRATVDRMLAGGDGARALATLRLLWNVQPNAATAALIESYRDRLVRLRRFSDCRLAVLRSFTLEPLIPILRAQALLDEINVVCELTPLNAYAQELLDPTSAVYRFKPTVAILAAQTRDLMPKLWNECTSASPEELNSEADAAVLLLQQCVEAFRAHSSGALILHGLELPPSPNAGVLDYQLVCGQADRIAAINRRVRDLATTHPGVYFLDYDSLIARHGRANWHDESKWLSVRMPIRGRYLPHLAVEWLKFIHPLAGRSAKVLVTDLDNTLWGGVVGEDGIDGIQIGPEYSGAGYLQLQKAMLDLYRRGIVLAIASKNNHDDAMQALDEHPAMLLRSKFFAAMRINWNDKAQSLREIAAELNLGVDSLAFVDDNPAERERIRQELPEVAVIDLPADPLQYAEAVRQCALFERLSLSEEDLHRSELYVQQRHRSSLEQQSASVEDFLFALEQQVTIEPLREATVARAAQLAQKTNQFNLTTRRYNELELREIAARPDYEVLTVRVRDRFGDNGLVGLCVLRTRGRVCEIESLLLSCRVIGRTVERALLAYAVDRCRLRGADIVEGRFIPTRKNKPAESFYCSHGFSERVADDGPGTLWMLDLKHASVTSPPWIKLSTPPIEVFANV
ncbi:MAG: HAD family hydrolase [Bryobacterales bacterium]|nr:HAD family hydrolase [Bryobacterales bacterium]